MTSVLKRLVKRTRYSYLERRNGFPIPHSCAIGPKAMLKRVELAADVRVGSYADIRFSTLGVLTSVGRFAKVTHADIGAYCAISWDVTINAVTHPYTGLTVSAFPYVPYVGGFVAERVQEHSRVAIGNDVWVGANSVILPGLNIGNGAIIGAGAVVTRDVPAYAIVAGVPARILRYRFSEEIVGQLLAAQWWNLDRAVIRENIDLFQGDLTPEKMHRLSRLCT
jgi:acetyltransferase-like isoleucine patch superfamily enzyme